jgi:hypothetical protein
MALATADEYREETFWGGGGGGQRGGGHIAAVASTLPALRCCYAAVHVACLAMAQSPPAPVQQPWQQLGAPPASQASLVRHVDKTR